MVRSCAWIALLVGLSGVAVPATSASETVLDCAKERTDPRACLACNVYHEARGESILGQRAVAMVVRNRVRSSFHPLDICSVVWEVGRDSRRGDLVAQFSWTHDNLPDTVTDKGDWLKALAVADEVLDEGRRLADLTKGALNYHSSGVDPYWRAGLQPVAQIGNHLFYRPPASGDPVGFATKDVLPAGGRPPLPREPKPAVTAAETFRQFGSIRIVRGGAVERVRVVREQS
jgi:hypothetical protein